METIVLFLVGIIALVIILPIVVILWFAAKIVVEYYLED